MGKEKERDARERLSTLLLCGPRVRCTTSRREGEGSIVRVVTMVEQNLNRRIELYSKPRLPPRRSFPSANQPRFSWLLVTANQPIPPRRGRAASPRFPIHARHASYRRFSNDENGEWRKDGRKPSTKKSPFRGKTKTRISRRGNTNLDSRSSSRLGRNNPS